jgi:hypothetical protein
MTQGQAYAWYPECLSRECRFFRRAWLPSAGLDTLPVLLLFVCDVDRMEPAFPTLYPQTSTSAAAGAWVCLDTSMVLENYFE